MIILKDVYYKYGTAEIQALCGVSLQIRQGEHLAVIGPNGCGKTTLIRHLNALLLPDAGSVNIGRLSTKNPKHRAEIRSQVGMVFQNPDHQIIGMTVEEDVAFGPENLRLPNAEIKKRVAEALCRVGIPELAGRNVEHLSGGEKRLVAIAGVLAMRPRFIALDEPTAFLDPSAARRVLEILDKLHSEGVGIIHVTHNMAEASRTQRIVVMNQGRIDLDGTPGEIIGNAGMLRQIGLQLPPVTEFLLALKAERLPVEADKVHMKDALDQVMTLVGKRKD